MNKTMRPRRLLRSLLALGFLLAATEARAQRFEISPFAGIRTSGSFSDTASANFEDPEADGGPSAGLILSLSVGSGGQIELLYSAQETDFVAESLATGTEEKIFGGSIDQLHFGGLYQWKLQGDRTRPFLAASLGVTTVKPDANLDSETKFSAAAGGGVKIYFSKHLGARFQGRLTTTFVDTNDSTFCNDSQTACFTVLESLQFFQAEFLGALIVAF
jgi:hypothetical protein